MRRPWFEKPVVPPIGTTRITVDSKVQLIIDAAIRKSRAWLKLLSVDGSGSCVEKELWPSEASACSDEPSCIIPSTIAPRGIIEIEPLTTRGFAN